MAPLVFLAAMTGLTAVAWMIHAAVRSGQRRALRRLAGQWQMRYSERDLFHIGQRIAEIFPVAGAADVRVMDLIYGTQGQRHRYLFTAQYTAGEVHDQRREERAMTFCESMEGGGACDRSPLVLGEEGYELVEQYRRLGENFLKST